MMKSAAFSLALEKPVEDISVREIIERAGVSRQAFYQHFRDRDDAVASAVIESLIEFTLVRDPDDPAARIRALFRFVDEHAQLYQHLHMSVASEQAAAALRAQLSPACQVLADRARHKLPGLSAVPTSVIVAFLVGGFMGLLRDSAEVLSSPDTEDQLVTLVSQWEAVFTGLSTAPGSDRADVLATIDGEDLTGHEG